MERQPPACPSCGSQRVAAILYGLPDDSEELKRRLAAKQVVLGGCDVSDADSQWRCNECQHEWRSD